MKAVFICPDCGRPMKVEFDVIVRKAEINEEEEIIGLSESE